MMKMNNKKKFLALAAVALLGVACAKTISVSSNESTDRYIQAWLKVNYTDKGKTVKDLGGVYLLDSTLVEGTPVSDSLFVLIDYTYKTMDGKMQGSTKEDICRQIGLFSNSSYYGPVFWQLGEEGINVGLERAIKGMTIGQSRTVLIPRWMNTSTRYSSLEEYIKHDGEASEDYIYEFTIKDATSKILQWQIDSIERYNALNGMPADSTEYGFYYKSLVKPNPEEKFANDTSFYINYTGKLLNGKVFDTSVADTAKKYDIYNPSRTYAPVKINYASEASKITMGSDESTVVAGFSKALFKLTPKEKCVAVFYSQLGYSYSGSGSSIPSFSPLVFQIEQVDYNE